MNVYTLIEYEVYVIKFGINCVNGKRLHYQKCSLMKIIILCVINIKEKKTIVSGFVEKRLSIHRTQTSNGLNKAVVLRERTVENWLLGTRNASSTSILCFFRRDTVPVQALARV